MLETFKSDYSYTMLLSPVHVSCVFIHIYIYIQYIYSCDCPLSQSNEVVSCQTCTVVTQGGSFSLSFCLLSLCVFRCLSRPLTSCPLGWGRGEPSGPRQTLSISIPLSPCTSLMTQAAPWYHDWPSRSALINWIDSCQSVVSAAL